LEPTISVVIPFPPGAWPTIALNSLLAIDYPWEKIEILCVEGTQPSHQRNQAVREAQGEIVYFLDSDCQAQRNLFKEAVNFYQEKVVSVGGPELTPKTDSYLQRTFGHLLSSWLGCFNTRYRFAAIGKPRIATEKSFILANFSIRRDIFLKEGGFNESLYPNEENELINRLKKKGYQLVYNPKAVVWKSRRETLAKFVKQIFSYGRGRMEHVLLSPFVSNLPYFIPLFFSIYLLVLIFKRILFLMLPLFF